LQIRSRADKVVTRGGGVGDIYRRRLPQITPWSCAR